MTESLPICTSEVCCIEQDIDRECGQAADLPRCKWAIVGGTIPEDHALCDGCNGDCPSAFEPA